MLLEIVNSKSEASDGVFRTCWCERREVAEANFHVYQKHSEKIIEEGLPMVCDMLVF